MTTPYDDLILQVATNYGLDSVLLTGQVMVESSADPFAFRYENSFYERYIRGNANAKAAKFGPLAACSYGMLQVMLEVAYELGFDGRPEDLFVDRVGLSWGARKMKACLDQAVGDYPKALAFYNGGTTGNTTMPYRNLAYAQKVYAATGKVMP